MKIFDKNHELIGTFNQQQFKRWANKDINDKGGLLGNIKKFKQHQCDIEFTFEDRDTVITPARLDGADALFSLSGNRSDDDSMTDSMTMTMDSMTTDSMTTDSMTTYSDVLLGDDVKDHSISGIKRGSGDEIGGVSKRGRSGSFTPFDKKSNEYSTDSAFENVNKEYATYTACDQAIVEHNVNKDKNVENVNNQVYDYKDEDHVDDHNNNQVGSVNDNDYEHNTNHANDGNDKDRVDEQNPVGDEVSDDDVINENQDNPHNDVNKYNDNQVNDQEVKNNDHDDYTNVDNTHLDDNNENDDQNEYPPGYNHEDIDSNEINHHTMRKESRTFRESAVNNFQWMRAEEWVAGGVKPKNIIPLIESQSSMGLRVKWYNDQNSDFIGRMHNDGIHEPDHGFESIVHTSFTSFGVAAKQYIYNHKNIKPPSWIDHIASKNGTKGGVRFCEKDIRNSDIPVKRAVCDGWTRVLVQCNTSC